MDDIARYRQMAADSRRLAQSVTNAETAAMLLEMAAEYDRKLETLLSRRATVLARG